MLSQGRKWHQLLSLIQKCGAPQNYKCSFELLKSPFACGSVVGGGSSFHKGRCNLLSSHVWHWLPSLAMQMRPVAAGIIWCPVNTAHEVKILSSNACQTGCGIKETCDLLCRYCIYRSDLPAANHPWQPCLANFKILLRSLSEAARRQKANHCIKVICFYGLILHTYEDFFLVCGWICWWICLLLL